MWIKQRNKDGSLSIDYDFIFWSLMDIVHIKSNDQYANTVSMIIHLLTVMKIGKICWQKFGTKYYMVNFALQYVELSWSLNFQWQINCNDNINYSVKRADSKDSVNKALCSNHSIHKNIEYNSSNYIGTTSIKTEPVTHLKYLILEYMIYLLNFLLETLFYILSFLWLRAKYYSPL